MQSTLAFWHSLFPPPHSSHTHVWMKSHEVSASTLFSQVRMHSLLMYRGRQCHQNTVKFWCVAEGAFPTNWGNDLFWRADTEQWSVWSVQYGRYIRYNIGRYNRYNSTNMISTTRVEHRCSVVKSLNSLESLGDMICPTRKSFSFHVGYFYFFVKLAISAQETVSPWHIQSWSFIKVNKISQQTFQCLHIAVSVGEMALGELYLVQQQ